MIKIRFQLLTVVSCYVLSSPAWSLEKMSDEQLSEVNAKGTYNFAFENIEYRGTAIPGEAEAGSMTIIGADGSSLSRQAYQFSATSIGTLTSPLTTGTAVANGSVNRYDSLGNIQVDGNALGDREYLRIGFPELAGWNNVDISYNAVFGNPTEADLQNPNIAAGGTASSKLGLGRVTIDNIALAGSVHISGIPEGYKIESVKVQDGSQGAASRQGLLLNVNIDELAINQWLLEVQQADGVFDAARDLVIQNFSLQNLHLTSATVEASASGWRFAYHDPQPFTTGQPGTGGQPDINSAAYNPSFPKANLSFESQMPHGQMSQSRIQGVTLDHLVFNLNTD